VRTGGLPVTLRSPPIRPAPGRCHVPADRRLRLGESRAATVGTGLAPADRLRVWAAGYLAPCGVGSRQPSDVDYPLASPGQARRVFTERSGLPGTKQGGRSA
jgi:hypothetical protein